MATNYIFFYGTLKRGGANHNHLSSYGCEFVGVGKARGCVLLNFGGFPGMIPASVKGKACSTVTGEVFAVPDENWEALLVMLDRLEHAWRLYLRVKISVEVEAAMKECTTYLFMPTFKPESVETGGEWKTPVVREVNHYVNGGP